MTQLVLLARANSGSGPECCVRYSVTVAHGLARRARDIPGHKPGTPSCTGRSWRPRARRASQRRGGQSAATPTRRGVAPGRLRGRAIPSSPLRFIREAVEHHRPELDALAGRGDALERPFMRPLVPHVIRDPVVFRDECLDRRVKVGERIPPRHDQLLRVFGQLATRLIDDIEPSLSTSGETLTIEESMTLRARTENAGDVGDEHEWSWGSG